MLINCSLTHSVTANVSGCKEKVGELEFGTYGYTLAKRSDGSPIFVNESRGHRYYVEQMAVQAVAGRSNIQVIIGGVVLCNRQL